MKYLVNRETKEHKILTDNMVWAHGDWRMVEADDEGWIYHDGGEAPIHTKCDVKFHDGEARRVDYPLKFQWESSKAILDVVMYRPILPAESNQDIHAWSNVTVTDKFPDTVSHNGETLKLVGVVGVVGDDSVFARLATAISASESIPALIAEINAMLPEGYEVREKAKVGKPQASGNVQWSRAWARKVRNWIAITEHVTSSCQSKSHRDELRKLREQISDYLAHGISKTDGWLTDSLPAEDMSDWRNWREGDLMEVIDVDDDDKKAGIKVGDKATIEQGCNAIPYCRIGEITRYPLLSSQLKFHSRTVTK